MRFEFATATRIVFGPGTIREVGPAARELGARTLLVSGLPPEKTTALAGFEAGCFAVQGEPTVNLVRQGVQLARELGCDVVVGLGGGSAIDTGKAIAALATNSGEPLDYLEVIGAGRALERPPLPFIAVPTTAGTGAEVTRNAVLGSPEHRVKASLRSPSMLARLAVVDPELTYDLPPAVTAATGMDALTQLIEPFVSSRANPMTDSFCLEGMRRAARSLPGAYANGYDAEARLDMSLASLLGGLALANAGLGAVHGFAAAIGGAYEAPHGAVCAALLPHVMAANARRGAVERYRDVARILTGRGDAEAAGGIEWTRRLAQTLEIPPLGAYGIREQDLAGIAENASKASSMKANPVVLNLDELEEILLAAL